MATNIPFNSKRLKSARLYNEMSIKDLAEGVGLSKQMISYYENGIHQPTYEKLFQISALLDFPMGYFIEEDNMEVINGTPYFRSLTSTTKAHRVAQLERMNLFSKILDVIMQYVDFRPLKIVRDEKGTPKEYAQRLREFWNLGNEPIDNLVRVAERNGIIVTSLSTEKNKVDAYSQWIHFKYESRPVIVLSEDKRSAVRRQFDMAHELGHLVMHEGIEFDSLTPAELRNYENEANEFAGHFLLPTEGFFLELRHPDVISEYQRLKSRWKTSIMAMIIRAYREGVITYNTYDKLVRFASKQGFRKSEPLDDVLPIAQPVVLKQSVELMIQGDVIPNNNLETLLIRNRLSVSKKRIEYLLGLPKGMLDVVHSDNNIVTLKNA